MALQDINGVSMMVIFLSRSLASVRVAMMAGTEQPNPMSIGTNERPESPILRSSLSITNATRAIYPLSSKSDRKKNSTTMVGKNDNTLPTPANTPSMMRECTIWLIPRFVNSVSVHIVTT